MNAKQLADKHGKRKAILYRCQSFIGTLLNPSYSCCRFCNRPWNVCKWHDTPISEGQDCFPLCEDCWSVLSPEERLPYYEDLVNSWKQENDRKKRFVEPDGHYEAIWDSLKKNVLAGL